MDLFLRKPLRPRSTPADWMARIRSSLFWRFEVRHKALLPGKALIDEKILFIMSHRVAEVHVNDLPAVAFKLMDYHPMEVLVVHGIVRAEGSGIILVDDSFVRMWSVVGAAVGNERRNFALEFDVEGFEDV